MFFYFEPNNEVQKGRLLNFILAWISGVLVLMAAPQMAFSNSEISPELELSYLIASSDPTSESGKTQQMASQNESCENWQEVCTSWQNGPCNSWEKGACNRWEGLCLKERWGTCGSAYEKHPCKKGCAKRSCSSWEKGTCNGWEKVCTEWEKKCKN